MIKKENRELKCLVLSAGLGTRLRPLTDSVPKPLASVVNVTLFDAAVRLCVNAGAKDLAVNTHHLSDIMARYALTHHLSLGARSLHISKEDPDILGTGGALSALADWWDNEDLLVYNGDILSDLPLDRLVAIHRHSENLVTMALRATPPPDGGRSVWFDASSGLTKQISKKADLPASIRSQSLQEVGFACAYIASPRFRDFLPKPAVFFDLIEALNAAITAGEKVAGGIYGGFWADVGNPKSLWETNLKVASISPAARLNLLGSDRRLGHGKISPTAIIDAASVVGFGVSVGAGAKIERSVLLEGAQVDPGEILQDCIRGQGLNHNFSQ